MKVIVAENASELGKQAFKLLAEAVVFLSCLILLQQTTHGLIVFIHQCLPRIFQKFYAISSFFVTTTPLPVP